MPVHLKVRIAADRLRGGQRFFVRRPSGNIWVTLPPRPRYGQTLRVRTEAEVLMLELIPLPRQERGRMRRQPLLDRIPELPIVAITPQAWEQARDELWGSIERERELAGICEYTVYPEQGVLITGLERLWEGQHDCVEVDFNAGQMLWHTHPGLDAAYDRFSHGDWDASDERGQILVVFGFGAAGPANLSRMMLVPLLPVAAAGLSLRAVLELERKGSIPRTLMKYGLRGRAHIPHVDDVEIRLVDCEEPESLADAQLPGVGGSFERAGDAISDAAAKLGRAARKLIED